MRSSLHQLRLLAVLGAGLLTLAVLAAGIWLLRPGAPVAPAAPAAAGATTFTLFDWVDDLPQPLLDAFASTHGVTINYIAYTSPEEANAVLDTLPAYDVALVEQRYIATLTAAGKLHPIDLGAVPNFRYTDPGFRNLSFDPVNHFSVPLGWGSTGIVARSGVLTETNPSWGVLWDERFAGGQIALWRGQGRQVIAATLKWLGYSANSEDPQALAAARTELMRLRPNVRIFDTWNYQDYVVPALLGQISLTIADTEDYLAGVDLKLPLAYYYPAEGALLWGSSLVIPAQSPNPGLATAFINHLLDPQVAAQVMNYNHLRLANQAALDAADPALVANPALFPGLETLRQAELLLPLSPQGQAAWDDLWADFLAAPAS